jgi:cyanophycinase
LDKIKKYEKVVRLLSEKLEGRLIIIGGAEDKEGDMVILREVCAKINKETDKLVIATVATEEPKAAGQKYTNIFHNLGVKNVEVFNVEDRGDANREENIKIVESAALIFFTGGDQLRITSILGGTPLYSVLKKKYVEDGCIFVGTSAGASVMSDTMIIQGTDDESPKKCTLKMAPGLALIRGVLIDQHFAQRGRTGRLLVGVAENPHCLGIGIDEDTAIIVEDEGVFKVIGSGAVYVIDGSEISYSNVSEQFPDDILSMFDVKMHVLTSGNKFDLNTRRPFDEQEG